MTTLRFKALVSGLVLSAAVLPAQERESSRPARSSTTVSKGILPDPLLLDGSKEAAEKIPEHGMLGEFELPGSENAKSDKVGGAQPEEQAAGAEPSRNRRMAEDQVPRRRRPHRPRPSRAAAVRSRRRVPVRAGRRVRKASPIREPRPPARKAPPVRRPKACRPRV
jgi:hypothetical protein